MPIANIVIVIFCLFLIVRGVVGLRTGQMRVGGYARTPRLTGETAQRLAWLGIVSGLAFGVIWFFPGLPVPVRWVLLALSFAVILAGETAAVFYALRSRDE